MSGMKFRKVGAIALSLAAFAMVSTTADARRGGSMGSRGSKTYVAPPATKTAPKQAAPVQKSTAAQPAPANAGAAGMAPAQKAGGMGGMAKGLIGGLVAGGLLGMLMGGGLGALGGSGMIMAILQIALIVGAGFLLMRFLRRRSPPAAATSHNAYTAPSAPPAPSNGNVSPFSTNGLGGQQQNDFQQAGFGNQVAQPAADMPYTRDVAITGSDKETFERLLTDIQDAYGREDYTVLRASTTEEMMGYFAAEISENAARGLRNNVSRTELLNAEVAEAWNETGSDYATIAMHYQSIDIMLNRQTGAVVEGNADAVTETTELWTFVRTAGTPWRLSAIQEA